MTLSDTLDQAKWTFSTRRVDRARVAAADTNFAAAKPGDLILAHVEKLGQHQRVQLPSGRPSLIFPGDAVVMACGARYAPDQFEGIAEIDPAGADLLAGGGCIGRMVARNSRIKPATRLVPAARLLDAGGRAVNLSQFALPPPSDIPAPASDRCSWHIDELRKDAGHCAACTRTAARGLPRRSDQGDRNRGLWRFQRIQ